MSDDPKQHAPTVAEWCAQHARPAPVKLARFGADPAPYNLELVEQVASPEGVRLKVRYIPPWILRGL